MNIYVLFLKNVFDSFIILSGWLKLVIYLIIYMWFSVVED